MTNKIAGAAVSLFFLLIPVCGHSQLMESDPPIADSYEVVSKDIIPKPAERTFNEGVFMLGKGSKVVTQGNVEFELMRYLETRIMRSFPDDWRKTPSKHQNEIVLAISPDAKIPAEGYRINIGKEKTIIEAKDRGGLFYGVQTFLQLLPNEIYQGKEIADPVAVPCQTITDKPFLKYRGVMLDVARTFLPKDEVLRFIDVMAMHKLNKMHWHLADDEGWRIELKSYPKLAETGGYRGGDSPVKAIYGKWDEKYGGYYTQEEIKEIVNYAAFRNIEIIPEIDLPGHSRATAKVMPEILCAGGINTANTAGDDRRNVWCAAKEGNYKILEKILSEVAGLFPSKYFHIGGDEVLLGQWNSCPDCKKLVAKEGYKKTKQLTDYFIAKAGAILEKNGKTACVWDEGVESGDLNKKYRVYGWQGVKQCLEATEEEYYTVVMPGQFFYLDMRQDPDEKGQNWSGVVTAKKLYSFGFDKQGFKKENMKYVLGVQGGYFSELGVTYGSDHIWFMNYPRISALAEIAWTDEKNRQWDDFYNRLTRNHFDRLNVFGVQYRLFPPESNYSKGVITAVAPFDGVEIRYTKDGSEPNLGSSLYSQPINDRNPDIYKFRAFYKGHASPSKTPTGKYKGRLTAGETKTFNVPLSDVADMEGMWYLRIRADDANMRIMKIAVTSADTTYTIVGGQNVNELHRMRYYAKEKTLDGKMTITLRNNNNFPCDVAFEYEKSPYIEPSVQVTTSMPVNSRFPLKNLSDYNFSTYGRTSAACKKGDHVTFTFDEPVDAEEIEVATGLTHMPRYHIPFGRVQVSADGQSFTDAAQLEYGKAVVYPEQKIKAIKIVSDSQGNAENAVAIQDLKIKPRK